MHSNLVQPATDTLSKFCSGKINLLERENAFACNVPASCRFMNDKMTLPAYCAHVLQLKGTESADLPLCLEEQYVRGKSAVSFMQRSRTTPHPVRSH